MTTIITALDIDRYGQVGFLTVAQEIALNDFKAQVTVDDLNFVKFNVESIDSVCLRFLRARNFNVSKSTALFRDCIHTKYENHAHFWKELPVEKVSESLNFDVEALKVFYPHEFIGVDRVGRPVLYELSGQVNGSAVHQMTTTNGLIQYHFYNMEGVLNTLLEEQSQLTNTTIPISTCVILDLHGVSAHHLSSKVMDHVKQLIEIDNTCYPEILGKMFIINAPWLAVNGWEMIRRWLDERTQQKIEIIGSDKTTITNKLLQYITPENLPVRYGGQLSSYKDNAGAIQNILHPPTAVKIEGSINRDVDYLHIPRYSASKKDIIIDIQRCQTVVIESYITENDMFIEVYSQFITTPAINTTIGSSKGHKGSHHHKKKGSSGHKTHENISVSDISKITSHHHKTSNKASNKPATIHYDATDHNPQQMVLELRQDFKTVTSTTTTNNTNSAGNNVKGKDNNVKSDQRSPMKVKIEFPIIHNTTTTASSSVDDRYKLFTIFWINYSMFFTKPLVYNIYMIMRHSNDSDNTMSSVATEELKHEDT